MAHAFPEVIAATYLPRAPGWIHAGLGLHFIHDVPGIIGAVAAGAPGLWSSGGYHGPGSHHHAATGLVQPTEAMLRQGRAENALRRVFAGTC
jgi:hypothetical protein